MSYKTTVVLLLICCLLVIALGKRDYGSSHGGRRGGQKGSYGHDDHNGDDDHDGNHQGYSKKSHSQSQHTESYGYGKKSHSGGGDHDDDHQGSSRGSSSHGSSHGSSKGGRHSHKNSHDGASIHENDDSGDDSSDDNGDDFGSRSNSAGTLGLLDQFVGPWGGPGYVHITLPNFDSRSPSTGPSNFRVLTAATTESLVFTPINSSVPNRGSLTRVDGQNGQNDINLMGFTYLQKVSDASDGSPLHIEPGIWVHVPATKIPKQNETYVRMGVIPHGDSILLQSTFSRQGAGGPRIAPVSPFPLGVSQDSSLLDGFVPDENQLPDGITQEEFLNPNLILTKAIAGFNITETIVIVTSSKINGGVVNVPFVTKNANAVEVNATFWLETVTQDDGSTFQILQYTQTIILEFLGIRWPHITVATLFDSDGPGPDGSRTKK